MRPLSAAIASLLLCIPGLGKADELLYFYRHDCAACVKFQSEMGDIYERSYLAATVRLEPVLADGQDYVTSAGERINVQELVPSFVLIKEGREVGRIQGYTLRSRFWLQLQALVKRSQRR